MLHDENMVWAAQCFVICYMTVWAAQCFVICYMTVWVIGFTGGLHVVHVGG